ncbi:MAG: thioredoxin-dependent thiol peroxidase [Acidimicrobiia bacterium]|nr:thioredoxin-dependent thiol peroxidase [Acidimicrobiia bacterium]
MQLETGQKAPAFTAEDQTGTVRTSDEFAGSKLIIYFYPDAFTPGCTTESCDFRDRHEFLAAQGYQILGVSPNHPDKLQKFKDEYKLPFDLLSDPDNTMSASFGAYGLKKNYGREYMGIIRSTFLIDADGVIEDAFYNVQATGHAERITKSIEG